MGRGGLIEVNNVEMMCECEAFVEITIVAGGSQGRTHKRQAAAQPEEESAGIQRGGGSRPPQPVCLLFYTCMPLPSQCVYIL